MRVHQLTFFTGGSFTHFHLGAPLSHFFAKARIKKGICYFLAVLLSCHNLAFTSASQYKDKQFTNENSDFSKTPSPLAFSPILSLYPSPNFSRDLAITAFADNYTVNQSYHSLHIDLAYAQKNESVFWAPIIAAVRDSFKAQTIAGNTLNLSQMNVAIRIANAYAVGASRKPVPQQLIDGLSIAGLVLAVAAADKTAGGSVAAYDQALKAINGGKGVLEIIKTAIEGNEIINQSQIDQAGKPLSSVNLEHNARNIIKKKGAEIYELGQASPYFADFWDASFSPNIGGVSIKADARTLVLSSKLDLPNYWKTILQPDGSISVTLGELWDRYQQDTAALDAAAKSSILRARDIAQFQGSLLQASQQKTPDQKDKEEEAKLHARNKQIIDLADSSLGLVARLAGLIDPKLGQRIGTAAGAAVKVASAINDFAHNSVNIFASAAVNKFVSGAILTGNIIGAALDITSLFGSGPAPEQQILEQINLLRQEVAQLKVEMHERFDRIDLSLNIIYQTINDRFDKIDTRLGIINANIDEIRTTLVKLGSELNRVERNVYKWIEAGFRRDLQKSINLYLNFGRSGTQMSYDPTFLYGENDFYTWAYNYSSDPLQADYLNRRYDDASIYSELKVSEDAYDDTQKYELDRSINFLSLFAFKNLGLKALSDVPVPNPRDWKVATDAYLQLGREWPEHRDRYQVNGSFRLTDIYRVGKQLQATIENITTTDASSQPKANRALFNALIDKYREKAAKFQRAFGFDKLEQDFKNTNPALRDVDIFGGTNQATTYKPASLKVSACTGGQASTTTLTSYASFLPNQFLLAESLGLGKIEFCVDKVEATSNSTTFFINSKFNGKLVSSRSTTITPKLSYGNSVNEVIIRWVSLDTYLSLLSKQDKPVDQQLAQEVSALVTRKLNDYQAIFYSRVLESFNRVDVLTALTELAGAKMLLIAYITFGFSQSLETDDFLRSLLFGNERVPEEDGISASKADLRKVFQAAIEQLKAGNSVHKVQIESVLSERIDGLSRLLNGLLEEIDAYHRNKLSTPLLYNYPQNHASVTSTLQSIESSNPATVGRKTNIAFSQYFKTRVNEPVSVTLRGINPNGEQITYVIVTPPSHGLVTGSIPNLIYTPNNNYIGSDSFSFKVRSDNLDSNIAVASFEVIASAPALPNFRAPITFESLPTVTIGGTPTSSVAADFNKDGLTDLAITDPSVNSLIILLGMGSGSFKAPQYLDVGYRPTQVVGADFNKDGVPDLAIAREGILQRGTSGAVKNPSDFVTILIANGNGSFSRRDFNFQEFLRPPGLFVGPPVYLMSGDFNNDGNADLLITVDSAYSNSNYFAIGDGKGGFSLNPAQAQYFDFKSKSGDFNNDGKLDYLSIGQSNVATSVLVELGNGKGAFSFEQKNVLIYYDITDTVLVDAAVADFNRDNKLDIALIGVGEKAVSLLSGDGLGGFTKMKDVSVYGTPNSIINGDFNGDNTQDLAITTSDTNSLLVLFNDGSANFTKKSRYFVDSAPQIHLFQGISAPQIHLAKDINADKKDDLVLATSKTGTLAILISQDDGRFSDPPYFPTGVNPYAITTGDFNGDRKLDVACANQGSSDISVLLGDGAGKLSIGTSYDVGASPISIVAADFNNDKKDDLAVACELSKSISILLNDGSGKFNKLSDTKVGERPFGLASGDLNADGKLDLVITDSQPVDPKNSLFVLLGNGSGGFSVSAPLNANRAPRHVSIADFDNDQNLDIAVTNFEQNTITTLKGDGKGGFAISKSLPSANTPYSLVARDFSKDSLVDLVIANSSSNRNFSLLPGLGANGFDSSRNYSLNCEPSAITADDFNGDGELDIALVSKVSSGVWLLAGSGYGFFKAPQLFGKGLLSYGIASGDFNGDGRPDLVVSDYDHHHVSILINNSMQVETVSPASYKGARIARGSIASAFGANLAGTTEVAQNMPLPSVLADTSVSIKDSNSREFLAPLFFVSPSQINYLIPSDVNLGAAVVTVTNKDNTSSGTILITSVAPGLFTANADGQGVPAAVLLRIKPDGTQIYEAISQFDSVSKRFIARPIELGPDLGSLTDKVFLLLFGTGIQGRASLSSVSLSIGGVESQVLYAGSQGGFTGLDQVNALLPRSLMGRGEVNISLTVDGQITNTVKITIK